MTKVRTTVHIPKNLFEEMSREAKRLDRTVSWLIGYTWRKARGVVAELPSDPAPEDKKE